MDYMMVPTNDEGFERPINPLAYIVFDLRNNQILHFDLIHPDQEDYEVIMNNFWVPSNILVSLNMYMPEIHIF